MSVSTLQTIAPQLSPSTAKGLRLRLKPSRQRSGFVHGGWWPRSTQLATELPGLLVELTLRLGHVERVVYDETLWVSTPLRIEVGGHSVRLEASGGESLNVLSVIGRQFGTLVLLVVPPYAKPAFAYTAVMTAADPADRSTADGLLGIDDHAAEERRQALLAQQRWETEGGALRRPRREPGEIAVLPATPEVQHA